MDPSLNGQEIASIETRLERLSWPLIVPLFATTLFLGSFLMFMVEPMIAKMVLPILGGAPMVWNTCVVFFQMLLLAGYAYAHGASLWIPSKRQAVVYSVLLLLPLAALPFRIHAQSGPMPQSHPILWMFVALATSIGPAFFVLSTAASVFQQRFSMTDQEGARDPYFLYAASNLGSLVALASYPTLIEPTLRLDEQIRFWTVGYAFFAIIAILCLAVGKQQLTSFAEIASSGVNADTEDATPPTWSRRVRWVALAFVPSSLMLGVTSYLSTDIAAVPLLWVVPLWLYLLTFVVTFGSKGGHVCATANRVLPVVILPLALMMVAQVKSPLSFVIPVHLLVFVSAALLCHGELAHDRPSSSHLTEFYFWLALGGMVGGLFNTLLAPVLFNRIVEYPLALGLACLLRPRAQSPAQGRSRLDVILPACAAALAVILIASAGRLAIPPRLLLAVCGGFAIAAFSRSRLRVSFAVTVGAMLLIGPWAGDAGERVLHAERTFFGVYRVSVDRTGSYHGLAHGTTLHGVQALEKAREQEPLAYFHRTGPFGQAFTGIPQLSTAPEIAVVGLGIGTLSAYGTDGQRWTIYEIDPAVERIARNPSYFSYLRHCGDRCRVVLGDARLSLATASPRQFGLIVLDAFSSDAVPMHLITSEALSLYLSRLSPGGVIAFNISNRHVLLSSILARLASSHGLVAREQREIFKGGPWPKDKSESHWVFMARNPEDLGSLVQDPRWTAPKAAPSTALWTDDFSNIVSVLSLR
jgi:hypothetical protein